MTSLLVALALFFGGCAYKTVTLPYCSTMPDASHVCVGWRLGPHTFFHYPDEETQEALVLYGPPIQAVLFETPSKQLLWADIR